MNLSRISLHLSIWPKRYSNLRKAFHAYSVGFHVIQSSKMRLVRSTSPSISSIRAYLYQNWSIRGKCLQARSQTLRAELTNLFRISISAYFSQRVMCSKSTAIALSNMERALLNSPMLASHSAYFNQVPRWCFYMRNESSKFFRMRYL